MSEELQISARVPVQDVASLLRRAKAADRTLSAEVRRAIRAYLAASGENDERETSR